jgi:hypothetical protein
LKNEVNIAGIDNYLNNKDFKQVSELYRGLAFDWPKIVYDAKWDPVVYSIMAGQFGWLNAFAFTQYFWNKQETHAKIVIFGHTHIPAIQNRFHLIPSSNSTKASNKNAFDYYLEGGILDQAKMELEDYINSISNSADSGSSGCFINSALKSESSSNSQRPNSNDSKAPFIYANSGGWLDSAELCTFVETEIMDNKHYVRLLQYTDDKTIHKAQKDYEYYVEV